MKNTISLDTDSALFQLLINQSIEVIILLDNEFKILIFNPMAENIFKCKADKIVGKKFGLLCAQFNIDDFLETKKNSSQSDPLTNDIFTKINGVPFSWSVFSVKTNGDVHFLLKAKLYEEEENKDEIIRLETLIENMPCNVYWMDKNCNMVGCNSNVLSMLNMTHDEYVGKTYEELSEICHWPEGLAQKLKNDDLTVMRTGQPIFGIEDPPLPHASDYALNLLTSRVPIRNNKGEIVGVAGISVDITDRKNMEKNLQVALEKAEAANRAKSEFISNMSHDVKTPLSGIISISAALCSRVQEEYRDLTQDVLQASQHLMVFFENCIELSKLESGSIVLSKEAFSLRHLLNEILHLFRPAMKTKGLALYVDYDEKIPRRLLGSRATFYRILLNLVGNAVKFTPQGSITIRSELSKNSTPERAVIKLTIIDTGIGIPADKQKLIFERFARLTPSYQGTYEGSGIGLYIVEEFVRAMSGEIHLKSVEGKGSQFILVVPLQIPLLADSEYDDVTDFSLPFPHGNLIQPKSTLDKPIAPTAHPAEPITNTETATETTASQIKILVVEDDLRAQKGVCLLLNSLGCKVDVATCGVEGVALFKPGKYDLVFMDIGLPDMKGYEVAAEFRKMEEGASFTVPILGLSAHATEDEKKLSAAVGMAEMLSKPLLIEHARAVLMQYVPVVQDTINEHLLEMESGVRIIDLQKSPGNLSAKEKMDWEILDDLVGSLPESRAEIEEAYKTRDIPLLIAKLHKFRGGLCYTKATHLLQVVNTLETNLRNDELDELDTLYANVLKAMETLERVYRSL